MKKPLKNLIVFLLICVLAFVMVACSSNENNSSSSISSIANNGSSSVNGFSSSSNDNSASSSLSSSSLKENSQNSSSKNESSSSAEESYSEKGIFFSSSANSGGNGSFEQPYNSLEILSTISLEKGAHIYLERGSKFLGNLAISNQQGTVEEPIVITAYGEGEKPKIDGNNLTGSAIVHILNCSNIIVEELELFDSFSTEDDRRGVLVTCDNNVGTEEPITYENVTLRNLYIHDICGFRDAENSGMDMRSKTTGGIHVWSNDGLGRIDGLTISNCKITNVSNVGIATWQRVIKNKSGSVEVKKVSPYISDFQNYAHLNVKIDNNEVSFIGKNAIFARNLYKGVIERNIVHDTAIHCVSGNSIVTSYVDGTIVQYNEGYRNMASPRPKDGKYQDGCMLDADIASKDTIWQYNYSHDNSFGLFMNCTYNNENFQDSAIVRYNLSVNDKGNKGIIYINYESNGIYVYNNTIVTATDTQYILQSNDKRKSFFYNNVIYNRSPNAIFLIESKSGAVASNNLIYSESGLNISGTDYFKSINESGIYENPKFIEQLPTESVLGIDNQSFYILDASSPALNKGANVDNVNDFFGNEYKPSIGFYCGK